jgi:hypothetical protein
VVLIEKFLSLTSEIPVTTRLEIFIFALVVAAPETVQAQLPLLGVLAIIVVQEEPPSRESSILTLPVIPEDFQVIAFFTPMCQLSLPLGEVTVIPGRGEPVKGLLLAMFVTTSGDAAAFTRLAGMINSVIDNNIKSLQRYTLTSPMLFIFYLLQTSA